MSHSHEVADRTLYVFAKEPRAGTVKTRLCPPLSPEQAADCHRAFVADTLANHSRRQCERGERGTSIVLAATPDDDSPWLDRIARSFAVDRIGQGEGDLGCRMQRVLRQGCEGGGSAVIIGSDSPDLPPDRILAAFEALQSRAVVVGQSHDGGYYLIGCRGTVPPVFDLDCAWGGPEVMKETRMRLQNWGEFVELDPWSDVDTLADLQTLFTKIGRDLDLARLLPETSVLLTRWREQGNLPVALADGAF